MYTACVGYPRNMETDITQDPLGYCFRKKWLPENEKQVSSPIQRLRSMQILYLPSIITNSWIRRKILKIMSGIMNSDRQRNWSESNNTSRQAICRSNTWMVYWQGQTGCHGLNTENK